MITHLLTSTDPGTRFLLVLLWGAMGGAIRAVHKANGEPAATFSQLLRFSIDGAYMAIVAATILLELDEIGVWYKVLVITLVLHSILIYLSQ